MNHFPPPTTPPAPGDEPTDPTGSDAPGTSRRRLALAAVVATALGVAGVAVGSQLAAADDAATPDERDETPTDDETDIDDEPESDDGPDADAETDDEPGTDSDGDEPDVDGEEPGHGMPDFDELFDLDELEAAFEEFDACLSEQLPDLEDGGWVDIEVDGEELPDLGDLDLGDLDLGDLDLGDLDLGDLDLGDLDLGDFEGDWETAFEDLGGSVTVFSPEGDDDLTFLDFGDGDGSITITQTDGEIEITTEGDVETIDADLPFEMGELGDLDISEFPDIDIATDPEFDAAFEECAALLPDDGIFEMVGGVLDAFDIDVFDHEDD